MFVTAMNMMGMRKKGFILVIYGLNIHYINVFTQQQSKYKTFSNVF